MIVRHSQRRRSRTASWLTVTVILITKFVAALELHLSTLEQ